MFDVGSWFSLCLRFVPGELAAVATLSREETSMMLGRAGSNLPHSVSTVTFLFLRLGPDESAWPLNTI